MMCGFVLLTFASDPFHVRMISAHKIKVPAKVPAKIPVAKFYMMGFVLKLKAQTLVLLIGYEVNLFSLFSL